MSRIAHALIGFGLAAAFYLLLIDTVSAPELYAGLGGALLAAIAFELSREQGLAEASFAPAWLVRAGRVLRRLAPQIGLVTREAFAQLLAPRAARGRFRAIPFGTGGEQPRDVGRRALAEALGSLTPNTIVIGIDPDRRLLLVHQLDVRGGADELDPLGLR